MSDDGDDFDFYPTTFKGQPASVYVNQRWESEPTPAGADTRYDLTVAMLDPGPGGLGTAAEADTYNVLEGALIARAAELGVVYVGRMRHLGSWWITLYGPDGRTDALRAVAEQHAAGRAVSARSSADAAWGYYRELLLPDAERKQWQADRRVVQVLKDQGDKLVTPRQVDHWAYFPTAAARDAFVERARAAGFALAAASDDGTGERPFGAHVHRTDPVELEHIHDAVMLLVDAAAEAGGDYDGWETSIES